jgi:sulfate adenylyltransferase
MISAHGGFIEVHVATLLETCEARDRKGLYAAARAGKIKEFTGISDPYEVPENPEVVVKTEELTPDLAAQRILVKLESMGFIR